MPDRSIALVEDERAVAEMYRLALESHGYSVTVHRDAPLFFEALETSLPDIVLLDWNLPSLNGGQVLERLRMDEHTRRLHVMILSTSPRRQFADSVMSRLAVLAWLEKPHTTPAQLVERIAAVFRDTAHTV